MALEMPWDAAKQIVKKVIIVINVKKQKAHKSIANDYTK